MAFHKDFSFVAEGDVIAYNKSYTSRAASLPPGQGLSLRFRAPEGRIRVGANALDVRQPYRVRVIGSGPVDHDTADGPGSTIEEFNNIAVDIVLIPPGQGTPVKSLRTKAGFSTTEGGGFEYVVAATAPEGEWEARVTNRDRKPARVSFSVNTVIREPLHTEFLAHRLLDHAYLVILEALQPSASLNGDTLTVSFGEALRGFFGARDTGPLGTHVIQLSNDTFSIDGQGHLNKFEIRARSGSTLLVAVAEHWQEVKTAIEAALDQVVPSLPNAQQLIKQLRDDLKANDGFRQEWEGRVHPDDAVIHVSSAFTDIKVVAAADFGLFDVDAEGVIRNAMVNLYLAFPRNLTFCNVLALSPVQFEPTDFEAKLIDFLGLIPALNEVIEEKLPGPIEQAGKEIGRFLGEALSRLAKRDSVFHSLTADDNNWIVRYTDLPGEPLSAGEGTGVHDPEPIPDPSLGVLPAGEFIVVKPETLARLDEIETLVFVMMENRSFDHMLGYLHRSRGPQYEGLRGGESNLVSGRINPVFMRPAREVIPTVGTRIPLSPNHEYEPVVEQIADGAMSGFAQDFENEHPSFAEMVMTFYTDKELKVFDDLAADFNVCDHWYCAHPGPTWPNRFVMLSGLTPELDNYGVDDPILGYLPERTIFDVLNERGITWAVYESDLSIIRMFNRFRLNATQVRPYFNRDDQSQSFVDVAMRGELPQVVFVEPNFVNIPPISTANDDHPPASLTRGQNFLAEVVEALKANPKKWEKTLLAITYDEHGGFYDHVAPPGTRLGPPEFFPEPPEFLPKIPLIHPQGKPFMGPRVPSFVVSPWVSAGSVCHDILDHTSIIKTILLRHRAKIPTRVFTQFGARVNMIAHLGVALDLDQPRTTQFRPLERMRIEPDPAEPGVNERFRAMAAAKPDDFHESLRRASLPKRR